MGCMLPEKKGPKKKLKKGEMEVVHPNMRCPHVQNLVAEVASEVKKKVLRRLKKSEA